MELNPEIRQYSNADRDLVQNLHITALKDAGTFIDSQGRNLDKDLDDIEAIYIKAKGDFLVATIDGKVVGMGALRNVSEDTAEVKRMRVWPEMQGKGIGKLILDALINKAKELGYKKIILDVAETQKGAQHLYESRGFKEYKRGETEGQQTIFYERYI